MGVDGKVTLFSRGAGAHHVREADSLSRLSARARRAACCATIRRVNRLRRQIRGARFCVRRVGWAVPKAVQ